MKSLTHHPAGWHQFAHHLFGLIHLPVAGLPMLKRSAAAKLSLFGIYCNTFRKAVFTGIGSGTDYINLSFRMNISRRCSRRWCGCYDIDNATYGFASV